MIFDATEWSEIISNEWLGCVTGKVEIRTSEFSVLYIRQLGVEAIASTGHHHRLRMGVECEYMIAMPGKQAKAYAHTPTNPVFTPEGEKFTNLERKPSESGTMMEVKKAVRELQLDAMMRRRAQAKREAERFQREKAERQERQAVIADEATKPAGQPEPEPVEDEADEEQS